MPSESEKWLKHKEGKPSISLLPGRVLLKVASVMTKSSVGGKHPTYQWRDGLPWREVYDSASRHMLKWLEGEDNDPETGENHIHHALCNLMFLAEYVENGRYHEFDNRYKPPEPSIYLAKMTAEDIENLDNKYYRRAPAPVGKIKEV